MPHRNDLGKGAAVRPAPGTAAFVPGRFPALPLEPVFFAGAMSTRVLASIALARAPLFVPTSYRVRPT